MSKDRFCILTKSKEIWILDFNNESKKRLSFNALPNKIFPAGINKILIKFEETLMLYEIGIKELLKYVEVPAIRQVIWAPNMEYLAILGKNEVYICNKDLEIVSKSPKERESVKSAT